MPPTPLRRALVLGAALAAATAGLVAPGQPATAAPRAASAAPVDVREIAPGKHYDLAPDLAAGLGDRSRRPGPAHPDHERIYGPTGMTLPA